MASQAPVVTQADIDAYIASFQKAQADQAAALAAAQATGMSDQYTQLYGGADIIPGTTQGILSNMGIQNPYLPVYSLIGSESVGNDLANERMQFAPIPGVSYRLVDKTTGETTTANTPEEIKALIAQSNALSASGGKGANLAIESNQTGSWSPVFTDQPNPLFNDITKLALAGMIAATGAGLLQPGGLGGLGAAGTSGAGAGVGATGSLAGAGLSSLPANLAAIQAGANAALAGAGLGTAAATGLGALAAGGIEALPGITVTAAGGGSILPAVGALAATGGAAAATGGAGTGGASGATNANQNLTKDQFGNVVDETGAIVSTGGGGSTSLLPAAGAAAGVAGAAAATGGGGAGATDATITQNTQNAVDTAYQNAQTGAAGDTAAAGYNGMGAGPFVAGATGAGAGGVFGTGLTAGQLATIGGLGASAIGSLVGGSGSGGTGTGTPYVSPFGAGPAIGGADFRVNPNIKNYEQYGFGGEATFFRPEYNKLVASGSMMGYTPTATTQTTGTQTYTPLIGGTTVTSGGGSGAGGAGAGGGGGGGGAGGGGGVKQERPAGFTGVVSGQQVGDTQVVDGTTWSYGGDQAGWQMQYTDPTTGNLALLPGNGATNVSSFANNPTVAVNQPYFAQNTANIPGWAETYQGFQRGLMSKGITGDAKAAAERELFSAIETQPFANSQALVDYARNVYNKYTSPSLI